MMVSHTQCQQHSNPTVSSILLNWNGKDDTLECLESLRNVMYANLQIILVDNASTDGLVDIVENRFPEVTVIQNSENLGFAEGNNVGIRYALQQQNPDYVLLLNTDTVIDAAFLSRLIDIGERNPEIGMLSPLIFWHALPEHLWFYSAKIEWTRGYCYHQKLRERPTLEDILEEAPERKTRSYWNDSDYLSGCALLVKTEVIRQIGTFDAQFFAYYEDVDWSLRCQKAGWLIAVVPSATIWHKVSATAGSSRSRFFSARNTILFLWKHSTIFQFLIRLKRYIYKMLAEYSWDRDEYFLSTDVIPLDGIWMGLQGKFGKLCYKMPIWLNAWIYRNIRYLLWIFGLPGNFFMKIGQALRQIVGKS